MAKSFKRAIACMLAVLMVAFSAPISALATMPATADLHPDIDIRFWTFASSTDGLWNDPGTADKNAAFDYCGLYDAPLKATTVKDQSNGSLKVTKLELTQENTAAMASYYNVSPVDYTYTTGDMFLATVVVKNVSDLRFISTAISYSDNIEPCGFYTWKVGRTPYYAFGTVSDFNAQSGATWVTGGTGLVNSNSAIGIYTDRALDEEGDYVDPTNRFMFVECMSGTYEEGLAPKSSPIDGVPFINPDNGDDSGYTYTNEIILASFAFKIKSAPSAANPIVFGVYDPDNTKFTRAYEGGSFSVDNPKPANYASYAEDAASPANKQMTIFGMNVNNGGSTPHTHTPGTAAQENVVAATCLEGGSYDMVVRCTECDEIISSEHFTTEALGHDFGEWSVTTPATCTAAGEETRSCSRCDATETQPVEALGHNYESVVTAPTCTEAGYTTYTCSRCGDSYTADEVAALGHDFGEWIIDTEATEEHAGSKHRECSRCDATETAEIPKLDHTHVPGEAAKENEVAATCLAGGSYDMVVRCTSCGEIISSEHFTTEALGHDFGEWSVVTPATCTDAGEETRSCSRCDATETQPIEALGHDYDAVVTAPTCTEAGYTTHTCSRCGDSYTDSEVAALGHDFGEWAVTTPATCTEAGEETRSCSRCDATETQPIAATGHTWGAWTVTKEATINAKGEETRTCSVCGATETRETESADITVTVAEAEGGTVSGSVASGETKTFKFGDTYALEATPADGYSFVAWVINGKNVGTSASYSGRVFANVTVEPVFSKDASDSFSVVFLDLYNTIVSEQTVSKASDLVVPTAGQMARQGYTFKGWDIDPASVTASARITGQYEVATLGYTVTVVGADDATINGEAATVKENLPYDSRVTVYAENVAGWKIGETIVSTDTSYSFYLGSNVTIEAVYSAVEAVPAITIIGQQAIEGSHRHVWTATRVVPEGYKVEKLGFVYGKNVEDDELILDNAGQSPRANSIIRVAYNNVTSVLETSLQYGLSAQEGKMNAKAFMIVSKNGKTEIIYSNAVSYTYGQDTAVAGDD